MTEWGVALIAAGSAVLGSLVTGWFTVGAGRRQADAARHAGDRQADALLATVRMTLEEQRTVRVHDIRRQAYVRFLEAAEAAILARRTSAEQSVDRVALQRALGAVTLEGPSDVAWQARELVGCLKGDRTLDDLDIARRNFIDAAQQALDTSGLSAGDQEAPAP